MKDPLPDDSLEYFVNQVLTEMTAEEKLQAAKRQINMERGRRMFRHWLFAKSVLMVDQSEWSIVDSGRFEEGV